MHSLLKVHKTSIASYYKHFMRWHSNLTYDVIIVGGGHAGTEASAASARMGAKTLLITHKKSMIGAMSCNPSFGGIGKGHLMKEVDALDGLCARICDKSGINYKILNSKKGPAVWGYRAQIDRSLYKRHLQEELFATPNLEIIEASVEDFILNESSIEDNSPCPPSCLGVILGDGSRILGSSVVLTTGTFLRGEINLGLEVRPAGRMGDEPAIGLANTLNRLGFRIGRLKTGTPPRLDKNTIDFSVCLVQKPDDPPQPFSFMNEKVWINSNDQVPCHMTFTNAEVDKVVTDSLHLNRHVREEVTGVRYCPSLESKVLRYPGRVHQVWLEPEGFDSPLVYPQGLACTMPPEFQQQLVNKMRGLEKSVVIEPGYGVEYDFVDPRELTCELETIRLRRLFFAGQINGTTGYEEAAAQGIVAGINAAAKSLNVPPLFVGRSDGYIGVLIDDLVTQGCAEPYRMFTSRAELRTTLRPDNADVRLTQKGRDVGCVSTTRHERLLRTVSRMSHWRALMLEDWRMSQKWAGLMNPHVVKGKTNEKRSLFHVLRQIPIPNGRIDGLFSDPVYAGLRDESDILMRLRIESLYQFAVKAEQKLRAAIELNQALAIPPDFDYYRSELAITYELKDKLSKIRPSTIAAASLIGGVTPESVMCLVKFLMAQKNKEAKIAVF